MREDFRIKLDLKDVPHFVAAATSIDNPVNVVQGQSAISGKSLMGVMALNLSRPATLVVANREDDDIVYEKFGQWVIN